MLPLNIDLICGLVWVSISLRRYRLFIIASDKMHFIYVCLIFVTFNTAVVKAVSAGLPFYLAPPPWTACPPRGQANPCWLAPQGANCPRVSCPHPGYLHPWEASCPGWFILPPLPNTNKKIHVNLLFFCIIQMNSGPP